MTPEEITISTDRMRFTKDTLSANAVIAAIVLDCLYFVSKQKSGWSASAMSPAVSWHES